SFKREPFRRVFLHSKTWAYLHSLGRRDELKNPPLNEKEKHIWERAKPHVVFGTMEQLLPDKLLIKWGEAIARTLHDHARALTDPQFTKFFGPPPPRSRKRLQILKGSFQEIDYRLKIDRDDLRALDAVMATEDGPRKLLFEIRWYLLPTV